MFNIFIASLIFSVPMGDNNMQTVGLHAVDRSMAFELGADLGSNDDTTSNLVVEMTPLVGIPTPLVNIVLRDNIGSGHDRARLTNPAQWITTADTTTGRYEPNKKYTFKLPYNQNTDYYGAGIKLYYQVMGANSIYANVLFTMYFETNYVSGTGGGYSQQDLIDARAEGKREGDAEGYERGKREGDAEGYERGKNEAYNNEWLKNCFRTLADILDIELFPGLTIGYIVALPLILALIAFIIGWFK